MGVEQNKEKAFKLYESAAEKGVVSAQCNLASFYKLGWGVDKNIDKAKEWYQKACANGDSDGCNELNKN